MAVARWALVGIYKIPGCGLCGARARTAPIRATLAIGRGSRRDNRVDASRIGVERRLTVTFVESDKRVAALL